MIRPVAGARPVDVLRQSSDQIRRAAALLAELTDETAGPAVDPPGTPFPGSQVPEALDAAAAREATIQQAQRSFVAGLRMVQSEVRRRRAHDRAGAESSLE